MSFVRTVINSCKTQEQLQSCYNWINNLPLNNENKVFSLMYLEDKACAMFYNDNYATYLDFVRMFEQNMEGVYYDGVSTRKLNLSRS